MPQAQSYKDQVVWIVGASSGIGAALALILAQAGARLVLSARRADKLAALVETLPGQGHVIVPCDAGDSDAIKAAFEMGLAQVGRIDRAVFMAALYTPHDGKPKSMQFIHDALRVNIGGAFHMMDVLSPYFQARGGGQIALCASVAGYRGLPTGQPYCATKAALISVAESWRVDHAAQGIDVKVISPGFVKTPLTDKNDFPMPMMISASRAAEHIARDLLKPHVFEIRFPKLFVFGMKILRLLPAPLYFWLAKRMKARTGVQ